MKIVLSGLLSGLLALHGYRTGSLSYSGAYAAFGVGLGTLSSPHPSFGAMLLVFYRLGSSATKVKAGVKAALEHDAQPGGGRGRGAMQVLCNSLTGAVAAVAYGMCRHPALPLVALGHFATCLGDTLASELGILSTAEPRLVTHCSRTVPRGTNGGVSTLGLALSAAGGAIIGATAAAANACSHLPSPCSPPALVAIATAAGLFGSLVSPHQPP